MNSAFQLILVFVAPVEMYILVHEDRQLEKAIPTPRLNDLRRTPLPRGLGVDHAAVQRLHSDRGRDAQRGDRELREEGEWRVAAE